MRSDCVSTECFVCGQSVATSQTVTVVGYTGRQGPPVIRLHSSCCPRLAAKILTTLEAPKAESQALDAVARHLNLSEGHVKVRVSVVLSKLGVSSRAEAAVLGVRAGLLDEENEPE